MSDTDRSKDAGLVAAVQELVREAVGDLEDEQLALLPVPGTAPMERDEPGPGGKRGRGRPPGSRNRSTLDWKAWIQGRYRDPREFLAEAFNRPVQMLAAELQCDLLEAYKVQIVCAKELLPYVGEKLGTSESGDRKQPVPLAIQVTEKGARLIAAHRAKGGGVVIDGQVVGKEKGGKSSG